MLFSLIEKQKNKSDSTKTVVTVLDAKRQLNFEIYKSEDGLTVNQLSAENYLKKRFVLKNIIAYQDFKFSFNSERNKGYVSIIGIDDTNQRWPIGVDFILRNSSIEKSGLTGSTGTAHSCEGNPCACCEFIYKSDGTTIKGCKCDTTRDDSDECVNLTDTVRCNHKISN